MSLTLLITADFHGDEELKDATIKEANNGDYDLYLNLGDFMDEEYAEELFNQIEIPGLGCIGNRDAHFSQEFMDGPVPVYRLVDAKIDDDFLLILIGGNFPKEIREQVIDLIENQEDSSKIIIGSHHPPRRTGDLIHSGKRIGFDEFRQIIMRHKPALWACGHVHEDYGEFELLKTKILNASSHDSGKGYKVEMKENGGVKKIEEVKLVDKKQG